MSRPTERLHTNHPAAAGQLPPVNPTVVHPVINGRATHTSRFYRLKNRKKLRLLMAQLTEKGGHGRTFPWVRELARCLRKPSNGMHHTIRLRFSGLRNKSHARQKHLLWRSARDAGAGCRSSHHV